MARDSELDHLKAAQDRAFQRKQNAYQTQDQAWKRRSNARDALDRAYQEKQRTYELQDAAWQNYQRIRSYNGPRIDSLNSQQENAFENMKRAFDNASSAHDRRDGASARMYADEGHRYKTEAQDAVTERRRLVEEIRDAKVRHEATRPAFQHAKGQFDRAKAEHDHAKAEHQRKQDDFKRAKAESDQAAAAFKKRLETVRAESKRRKDDKHSIAERAGVPYQYRDNVWVSRQPDGIVNVYFGGVGKPNGPGHGHYVMDHSDRVIYRRDPFDPHGGQNFEGPGKDGHRGGFEKSQHGWIEGHPVTFALGWGTKQGHTLIADGHLSWEQFRESRNHDHYGPGDGPNSNGTLRRKYTGPGA